MYVEFTARLRYAKLSDLFYGNMNSCSSIQFLKDGVPYFFLDQGKLKGTYYTPNDPKCQYYFSQYYTLIINKKILIIDTLENEAVMIRKIYLRRAEKEDLNRFSIYFTYKNKKLAGPYPLSNDFENLPKQLIEEFKDKQLFVINEKQKLDD